MVLRSLQRELSTVTIAVGGVVTGSVIYLKGRFIRWQCHIETCTVRRYRHIPLGIERLTFLERLYLTIGGIVCSFTVGLCVPTSKIKVITRWGVRSKKVAGYIVLVVVFEYRHRHSRHIVPLIILIIRIQRERNEFRNLVGVGVQGLCFISHLVNR